jgi:hypothetical protein
MKEIELFFPNKTQAPPGGWRYTVPETGKTISGSTEGIVIDGVQNHYSSNNIPGPVNLSRLIEKQICRERPNYCGSTEPHLVSHSLSRNIATIVMGTRTIGAWLFSGRRRVEQQLAEERAVTCSECPQNQVVNCTACHGDLLAPVIENIVAGGTTKVGHLLNACMICGCAIKAKIWVPHDIIESNMPDTILKELPANCWVVKEGK